MAKPKPASPGAPKTATIRARIDPTLKANAEAILDTLGLNPSDAIRLFYTQIGFVAKPSADAKPLMRNPI